MEILDLKTPKGGYIKDVEGFEGPYSFIHENVKHLSDTEGFRWIHDLFTDGLQSQKEAFESFRRKHPQYVPPDFDIQLQILLYEFFQQFRVKFERHGVIETQFQQPEREGMVQLADLIAVATLTEDIILMIRKQDQGETNPRAMKLVLPEKNYYINGLHNFLKFAPHDPVERFENPGVQNYYRDRVCEYYPEEVIGEMLREFTKELNHKSIHKMKKTSKIKDSKVLFIKLGKGGEFERECIEENQTLRLDYNEVDHNLCKEGRWEKVRDFFIDQEKKTPSVATSHTNQIKQFYEEGESTLWITFYANKLWWCFSSPEVTLLKDNTKTRPVIGRWSDKDISDNILFAGNISGKLLKTQGFRGTICKVPEQKYALAKINSEQMEEVVAVEKALSALKSTLKILIQKLQWQDFETLVDLIFRQAGWQRVSEIGKAQKTLDLELLAPVTGERAIVQIKAHSDLNDFKKYQEKFDLMNSYDRFFYVVLEATKNLAEYENETDINLYLDDKIAELTISSGLVEWVIQKTS